MSIGFSPLVSASTRAQRGFNLVEAAIVLGVVGLVIGGIWTAASAVQSNMRNNQTKQHILALTHTVANVFQQHDVAMEDITGMLANGKLAPADMISGSALQDSWGKNVVVRLSKQGTNQRLGITFDGQRSVAACVDMVYNVFTTLQIKHCGGSNANVSFPSAGDYTLGGNGMSAGVTIARDTASLGCTSSNGRVGIEIPLCQ